MLVLTNLESRKLLSTHSLSEDSLNLRICVWLIVELLDTVVAQLTAILGKEVVTLLESINHILECSEGNTSYLTELIHIFSKLRLLDVHSLVWTPSWNHLDLETALACLLVVTEIIDRIICCTDALYIIVTHQAASAELRLLQLLITLIVDLTCSLRAQLLVNTESCLELQVCPVIKRVTESIWYSLCPFLELLPVAGVSTCAETLIYTIGTHSTPLVVVTTEPEFCNALELVIIRNHLRDEVAVIIDDWHLSRMIVEKILRCLGVKQEVFIHKLLHNCIVVFKCLFITINYDAKIQ